MKLLDLPAEATRLLCHLGGMLNGVVGHDQVRAVGGHLNPEQAYLVILVKAIDFNGFYRVPVRADAQVSKSTCW